MLGSTLVAVVAAGFFGGGVFLRLSGGFSDPDAESSRSSDQLEEVFETGDPNLVSLVSARKGSVDDRAVAAEGGALTEELASEPAVEQVFS